MNADEMPRRMRYSTVAILLHWAIAALLIFQVVLGLQMEDAAASAKFAVFQLHKSIGITILLLVAIRLVWRLTHVPPRIEVRPWERTLAHAVHGLLYLLMFALPVSGWLIVSTSRIGVPTLLFGSIPWPHLPVPAGARTAWHAVGEFLHGNLVWVLVALFALHVAGALKHHFLDRDGDIAKMVPGVKPGAWSDPRLLAIAVGVVLAAGLGLRWLPAGSGRAAPGPVKPVVEPIAPAPMPSAAPLLSPSPSTTPTADAVPAPDAQPMSQWRIAKSSKLTFRTRWSGGEIDGGFTRFDGDIAFSPDNLAKSKVAITIDTASVYSGDAQRDETLKSADWFSADSLGTATFTATKFRKLGGDRYAADGTLRIKGVSLPSTVRFTLTITGDTARMRGTATVDRTAYRIGEGDYASTSDIPAAVAVTIAVDATRVKDRPTARLR